MIGEVLPIGFPGVYQITGGPHGDPPIGAIESARETVCAEGASGGK